MKKGKVKFYNVEKGFGFIIPESKGEKDLFFHVSNVENKEVLAQDDEVSYEIGTTNRGPAAINVKKL